ncbi:MAG: RtcB family protein [Mangrovibacterium sp.]
MESNAGRRVMHFGTNVIVHRKGATRAREGEIGIIPGSRGTEGRVSLELSSGKPAILFGMVHEKGGGTIRKVLMTSKFRG